MGTEPKYLEYLVVIIEHLRNYILGSSCTFVSYFFLGRPWEKMGTESVYIASFINLLRILNLIHHTCPQQISSLADPVFPHEPIARFAFLIDP